ncbi:Crp/Fnr family transcriptional regulator [Halomonas sp. TD01]|uniref:Crp/Fnr family transcriptional regulator n=1 Tax=Halomonas sp. TD01 TaxID=999141 RepID=UPI000214D669|nr:Crp/Fnr family transcriptional regulator [Halomonas sp. TD01]EGP18128.1 Crp/FNR family transcriptional regulator [Halomonas sp. TD01]CAH1043318.1 cAMP-binding proteins - catabolite gene activator and regulatory subunit of cAMP-dependent protein kinases [Halomonas sp. TD01]
MKGLTADRVPLANDISRKSKLGSLSNHGACINIAQVLGLYGEMGEESLNSLSKIRQKPVELKKNQQVFSVCEGRADIFVIKEGWASLSHATNSRGQDVCNIFMPGDIIGMRESFFESRDIIIFPITNCELIKVSGDHLHALCKENEEVRKAITSYVMVNDNITIERLRSCTHHRSVERVAHFLLEVYARFKFKGLLEGNVFDFPVTQETVGELLGMTSVHVSRCMTALEQKKFIRKTRSSVKLLKPEEMAKNTGFDSDFIYGHICLG